MLWEGCFVGARYKYCKINQQAINLSVTTNKYINHWNLEINLTVVCPASSVLLKAIYRVHNDYNNSSLNTFIFQSASLALLAGALMWMKTLIMTETSSYHFAESKLAKLDNSLAKTVDVIQSYLALLWLQFRSIQPTLD